MKFFGKSRFTDLLEEYHPFASLAALIGIGSYYYYDKETYTTITDISYPYPLERDGQTLDHYRKGPNDKLFVFFVLNLITVFRYVFRKLVLEPLVRMLKLKPNMKQKFLDAGWFSLCHFIATAWGYYIFSDDPWWYSSPNLWAGYPHPFDYHTKYYYLASLAFWIQSLWSFFFEPPRKDDKAFFFHHLLTIGLIMSSYRFNFFRVGAAILMEQNAADILYYLAKVFKYGGSDNAATGILVVFVFSWVYTRHYIFGWILYSLWFELPDYLNVPGWDDVNGYYYADWLYVLFSFGLVALQLLMIYWFFLILRVIYRVVFLGQISDTTDVDSDEEVTTNGANKSGGTKKQGKSKSEKKKVK